MALNLTFGTHSPEATSYGSRRVQYKWGFFVLGLVGEVLTGLDAITAHALREGSGGNNFRDLLQWGLLRFGQRDWASLGALIRQR